MGPNYIALAIPFFFLCIAIELVAARVAGRRLYRFTDTLGDLGAGILSESAKVFLHGVLIAGYVVLYRHRLLDPPQGPLGSAALWLLAIVAVDFLYYWWHRLSHEVNFLWAAHVVHHTSEDYNLAVALRQSILTHFTGVPFYLPLALLGVPPATYLAAYAINLLYQFWIHTEMVRRLGPLEWVMNTPSHHRVHHAINPRYLDRNYAGIFIVWDRLFGTYVEESEPPVYGTVKPLASFNPAWAQVHYWFDLARDALRAPRAADRWRVWVASPAWHPAGLLGYPTSDGVSRASYRKFEAPASRALSLYVGAWFVGALVLATALIFFQDQWAMARLGVGAALVTATLIAGIALVERRPWARAFEVTRLAAVAAGVALVASQ